MRLRRGGTSFTIMMAAFALAIGAHSNLQSPLQPDDSLRLADTNLEVDTDEQHGVDALLRAACLDPVAASYLLKLFMSTHPDFNSGWEVEYVTGTDNPAAAAELRADIQEATTALITSGWCALRVGKRNDFHPQLHAPMLSHVIFRAAHELLSTTDAQIAEKDAPLEDELPFRASGRDGLSDAQLSDLARRAALLLMTDIAEDLNEHQGLEAAILEYRAAWAAALAWRMPHDPVLRQEIAVREQAKAEREAELLRKQQEEEQKRQQLMQAVPGANNVPQQQVQGQNNAPIVGNNIRNNDANINPNVVGGAQAQQQQLQQQRVMFAQADLDAESRSHGSAGASARARSAMASALSLDIGASLGSRVQASIEAAGSVEAWEMNLLASVADQYSDAGGAAGAAAGNGVAMIQRLTNAFVALATHTAFEPLQQAFGTLLPTMCELQQIPNVPPGMQNVQQKQLACSPSQRASIARVFASVTMAAAHQYAWAGNGLSDAIKNDGHAAMWDLQDDEAARSAAHALFGLQSVLLQVRDVCAIEDVEGMPTSLVDADKLRSGLFGDRSALGLTADESLSVHSGVAAGKASPSPRPAGAAPAQGVSMLRGAEKGGLHPEQKLSTKLLIALGLAADAGAADAGAADAGAAGTGQGVTLTAEFLQMSDAARAAIENRLFPAGRLMPAVSPDSRELVQLPKGLKIPEDEPAFDLAATLVGTYLHLPADAAPAGQQQPPPPPSVDVQSRDRVFALSKSLARFLMLARVNRAAVTGLTADDDTEPPAPPMWLYGAAMVGYAQDGYTNLFEVGSGVPVIKYSEDKATLTDKGKWQDRRLRIWHKGITFADDSSRVPRQGDQFDRMILHSSTSAVLVPAPRSAPEIKDAALASIADRSLEGRLCGVIASSESKRRRSIGDAFSDGHVDPWRSFDVNPETGKGLYNDGAQYVPRPNEQTRYYSFCTRGKVTERDTADARLVWLRDAEGLATAFCAAAHNSGLAARAKLEQWWAVQVLRTSTHGGTRSSLSKAAAQALRAGGLETLDCAVLLARGHLVDEAKVRAQPGLQPAAARRNAAAPELLAVNIGTVGGSPPDVWAPQLPAQSSSAAKLALEKLADTGKRLAPVLKSSLFNDAGVYAGIVTRGLTPAFESEQMAKYAKEKAASTTAMRPAGVVGLQPSIADRRFWAMHARMTAGGRQVETSIDDGTLAALWVAFQVGGQSYKDRIDRIGLTQDELEEGKDDALTLEHSGIEAEDKFTGVYRDSKNKLLIIAFKAKTGQDSGDAVSGARLLANKMRWDRARWRRSARPRIHRALQRYPGYSLIFTGWCMGGHMAQVASDVFQAPAILFNPAPRVAAGLKLAAAWTLAVPLQVANLLTLGITRKIGNAFNSRGVAGMSRPMTGFWRVIAPRERGPLAGIDETMEWMASVAPVPGNGMTIIHAAAGDVYPASYFHPGATGYELHLHPPVVRRTAVAAHDLSDLSLLPRRIAGPAGANVPGSHPLQFPEKQGSMDSEAITLEYPQACLAIYGKWMKEAVVPEYQLNAGGGRPPVPATLESLALAGQRRKSRQLQAVENEKAELEKRGFFKRWGTKAKRALRHAIKSHVLGDDADSVIGGSKAQKDRTRARTNNRNGNEDSFEIDSN